MPDNLSIVKKLIILKSSKRVRRSIKMDKIRILIVEDEGIQAMALEETLISMGYEVTGIADNGRDALDIVGGGGVDLVILDVHIKGDMDGIETAKKILEIDRVAIVYLTAFMDSITQNRAEQTNPAAFLTKPYRDAAIRNAVEAALVTSGLG
jgi:two-component system, response regulator PdtaR